jgi:hypothetical protein
MCSWVFQALPVSSLILAADLVVSMGHPRMECKAMCGTGGPLSVVMALHLLYDAGTIQRSSDGSQQFCSVRTHDPAIPEGQACLVH